MSISNRFIYNCPVHGEEHQLLCWRAYSPSNIFLWKKYILVETSITDEDLDTLKTYVQERQ